MPEAKVIVDTTRNPTSHGPPSMKLLRRKSLQIRRFKKGRHHQMPSNLRRRFRHSISNSKGEESVWDDERIVALRKFYALRDEAENTVLESKRIWVDTPFSLFALQCKFHFDQSYVS